MKDRDLILLSVAAMLAAAVAVAMKLPADAQLPIHWGIDGEPDGFAGKWVALCMPAVFAAAMAGMMAAIGRAEPMQESLARSAGLVRVTWIGLVGVFAAIELIVIGVALGWTMSASRILLGVLGIFLMVLGNQLGKTRRMHLIGIRTPWTLADEDVWIATHRLGGKLMTIAGASCVLLEAAHVPVRVAWPIGLGLILAAAIVPAVYSYMLWKRTAGGRGA